MTTREKPTQYPTKKELSNNYSDVITRPKYTIPETIEDKILKNAGRATVECVTEAQYAQYTKLIKEENYQQAELIRRMDPVDYATMMAFVESRRSEPEEITNVIGHTWTREEAWLIAGRSVLIEQIRTREEAILDRFETGERDASMLQDYLKELQAQYIQSVKYTGGLLELEEIKNTNTFGFDLTYKFIPDGSGGWKPEVRSLPDFVNKIANSRYNVAENWVCQLNEKKEILRYKKENNPKGDDPEIIELKEEVRKLEDIAKRTRRASTIWNRIREKLSI